MRALLAAALIAAAPLPAAPAVPAVPVTIAVIASDARGRPVATLEASDFSLTENGEPETIDSVRYVRTDGTAPAADAAQGDERGQAARAGARLFAIYLDEYHVSREAAPSVRELLTRFVDRDLGPRDVVAVMKPLDSLFAIRASAGRGAVRQAIDAFEGRKGDYTPRSAFEREYLAGAPDRIEQARDQVTISALNALTTHLGALGIGRKAILLVSEGFGRAPRRRGLEPLPTLQSVVRAASRQNVSIYPFDPRAAAAAGSGGGSAPADDFDRLKTLADETAGVAIRLEHADAGLHALLRDSSAYYLLTYHSSHAADGLFRPVSVRVGRPGIRLRARTGYWAPFPGEGLAAEEPGEVPGARPVRFDLPWRISPLIKPWFGMSRGADGRTRVTFVWEPVAPVPGDRSRRGEPSRVALEALDATGATVFDGIVWAAGAAPLRRDAPAQAVFEVPPGRVGLKMSVEDSGAAVLDHDVREIAVRALADPVALGTPEVLRARNALEFRDLAGDQDAPPVAARAFSRTEHLLVRVAAYAPAGRPRVAARLLTRFGQPMRALAVRAPSGPAELYQFDLPLASLPPGDYVIEITASSPAGTSKDLVNFRVTG